jgi:hypothetical protein
VEVVEHEHERLGGREVLEQRAHGAMAPVALVLERDLATARERRQGREDVRKLGPNVVVEDGETIRSEPSQVLVERVDEDRERQIALELGRRAQKDEVSLRIRASGELGEEARLSDARLADEQDRGRPSPIELGQDSIQRAQLLGAPDEMVVERRHFLLLRRINQGRGAYEIRVAPR